MEQNTFIPVEPPPPIETPVMPSPPAVAPSILQNPKRPWTQSVLIAGIVITVGIIGLMTWKSMSNNIAIPATPTPTPTTAPSPTPVRQPSSLATESAFLNLANNVASLSASIQNYVVEDPSLSPPVLDLPLGFTR